MWYLVICCYGFYSTVKQEDHCIDDIDDIQQSGNDVINPNRAVIVPHLQFSCNGRISNIKVGLNSISNGSDFPYVQIWRPSPPSQLYSLVDKVQIQSSHLDTQLTYLEANIPFTTSSGMLFLSGDVIGFYNPLSSGYAIRDAATDNYVFYKFIGSEPSQVDLNTGIAVSGRQPLIQLTLGELFF